MKRCLIIQSLAAGGAERCAATLANHWAGQGREVVLITLASRTTDFYALHPAVRRVALELDAPSAGVWQAILSNGKRVRALRRVLRQEAPRAVLAMMAVSNCLLALAAWGLPLVAVGSEHTHPPMLPLGRVWELARKALYGRLHAVVCLTGDSAAWIRRRTLARRVHVIPNSVPWPMPRQEPMLPVPVDSRRPRLLLAVGRLAEEKRFALLLHVFAGLADQFPDWRLVVLGEGPERQPLERLRTRLGLEERVLLPGLTGNVGDWYAAADLYVMSSRFEGFGNTLAEALAHGLPAVAVDCETGPREILRHEVDGLLVPQADPSTLTSTLAAALARMMADEALRRRMGEQAVAARERFGLEAVAGQWEALFHALTPQDQQAGA